MQLRVVVVLVGGVWRVFRGEYTRALMEQSAVLLMFWKYLLTCTCS